MKTLLFAAFIAFAASANASENSSTCTSEINSTNDYGNTALMVAAAHGDAAQVQHLIEQGADIDARGYIGNTALIFAIQEGHTQIVEMLVEAGANINANNDYNTSARSLAIGYGHREIAQALETVALQVDKAANKNNRS